MVHGSADLVGSRAAVRWPTSVADTPLEDPARGFPQAHLLSGKLTRETGG